MNIFVTPNENNVSKAWNKGIKLGLEWGARYVIVANSDIIMHESLIDNLVQFAERHPEFILWTASEHTDLRTIKNAELDDNYDEHPHFSCFMVNQRLLDTVGYFDENFVPAYFEDSDFHYRILLSGNKAAKTGSAKFYHYGSRTIKLDHELERHNVITYEKNRAYLKEKWGFDPHGHVFEPPEEMLKVGYSYPFNNDTKTIKDW